MLQVGSGFSVALGCALSGEGADYRPFLHQVPSAVAAHAKLVELLGVPEV
jgi:hypothetical protein